MSELDQPSRSTRRSARPVSLANPVLGPFFLEDGDAKTLPGSSAVNIVTKHGVNAGHGLTELTCFDTAGATSAADYPVCGEVESPKGYAL